MDNKLRCPECGSDYIAFLTKLDMFDENLPDVRCMEWECMHEGRMEEFETKEQEMDDGCGKDHQS